MRSLYNFLKLIYLIILFGNFGILNSLVKSTFLPPKVLRIIKILNYFCGRNVPDIKLGNSLAKIFTRLGPAYVKLGQALATRPDLLGSQLTSELSFLHDNMPPFKINDVDKTIFNETGKYSKDLFLNFNAIPIAAASISQVHQATSHENKLVAVKILRPNIEIAISKDLEFFEWVVKFFQNFDKSLYRFKLLEIIDIFKKITSDEMDLRLEAASASELAENFKNDERFVIPEINWSLTTKRMLVLDWIDGVKIDDKDKLIKENYDIQKITSAASEAFFCQVFRDGFFHGDMHPGNFFINSSGQLIPIDFGIMGRLNISDRLFLARLLKAILDRDFLLVAKLHKEKGMLPDNQSINAFALAVRSISTPILDKKLGQISLGSLLGQLFSLAHRWELDIQPQFLLLQKTMVMAEGIGRQLNPDADMWEIARPMVTSWLTSNALTNNKFTEIVEDLKIISNKLPKIIDKLDNNKEPVINVSLFQKNSFLLITAIISFVIGSILF